MREPIYGLVLSGGGVRGLAHIGVIKALEEEHIKPAFISGASAGAIIGVLYAAGHSSEEILDFFLKTSIFTFDKYAYGKPGFLDTDKFYELLKTYLPEDNFNALKKTLFVAATNILTGESKIFHEGALINAVLASAAFPVVLSPIKIENQLYADGGITNNFPVEPLRVHCDKIIGVYVNPLDVIKASDLSSSRSVLDRALKIGMNNISVQKFNQCDLVIAPELLSAIGTFSTSHLMDCYEIGYLQAKKQLAEIRRLKEA
jgi:NTE family protein